MGTLRRRIAPLVLGCVLATAPLAAAEGARTLVACAPGFPGNTADAQPTMDELAGALAGAVPRLSAVYHEQFEAGLARLAAEDTAIAIVPLPLFLQQRERLGLEPLAQIVPTGGADGRYSLVAATGKVDAPAALAGWEIAGMPGYAPRFVRNVVLAGWGRPPADVKISFSANPRRVLREAAGGAKVAALLDGEQTAALPALREAAQLQVVTQSPPLPAGFVCNVQGRLSPAEVAALTRTLLGLNDSSDGAALLDLLRMQRFEAVDADALARAVAAYAGAGS